ncbi:EpsG family protein [uncultured Sphaerotilus sp.]|uniref:EpsG family protein n=1 Tax=uncultured Sphaerotilus sp. TaxID=474984 RepID=UPI0030CA4901
MEPVSATCLAGGNVIYFALFSLLTTLLWSQHRRLSPGALSLVVGLVLATLAALRGPNVAADFTVYETWYTYRGDDAGFMERPLFLESIYFLLNDLFATSNLPFRAFVWVLGLFSVVLKLRAIMGFSQGAVAVAVGFLVYAFTFFLLHDFTQIRAGLAVAVVFCALPALLRDGNWPLFLLAIVVALGFHSSALIFFLILLPLQGRLARWIDGVLLGVTAVLFGLALRGVAPGALLMNLLAQADPRIALYVSVAESANAEAANPLSLPALVLFLLVISMLGMEWGPRHALGARMSRWFQRLLALRGGDSGDSAPPLSSTAPAALARPDPLRVAQARMMRLARRCILFGLVFLIAFAPIKEVALRLFEINIALLPLLAACLFSYRGLWMPKTALMLWVAATGYVYILRDEGLVQSYALYFL